jgi:hypothetical protein
VRRQDHKLLASSQAPEFRVAFETAASAEARRRDILGAYYGVGGDGLARIQRAAYWNAAAQTYLSRISNAADRQQIDLLTREFADSQTRFNELYVDYQEAVNRLAESHGLLDALNIIDKVAGVIGGACRINDLLNTLSSKPHLTLVNHL